MMSADGRLLRPLEDGGYGEASRRRDRMSPELEHNLVIAVWGTVAGAMGCIAIAAGWRRRSLPAIVAAALGISAALLGWTIAQPPPGVELFSADRLRPQLVSVGAIAGFVAALLIGFGNRKRTWFAGAIVLAMIIGLLYFLVAGPVTYVSNIE
jgi:hypothetical protein